MRSGRLPDGLGRRTRITVVAETERDEGVPRGRRRNHDAPSVFVLLREGTRARAMKRVKIVTELLPGVSAESLIPPDQGSRTDTGRLAAGAVRRRA